MIKKLVQLFWYEKEAKVEKEHRTIRKNFARVRRHGLLGSIERLNKDYISIQDDYITQSVLNERYRRFKIRIFFIVLFFLSSIYYLAIKSELYESQTALIVRDIQSTPSAPSLGLSLLGMGGSSQLQDSMIVQEYLKSLDLYKLVDDEFQLTLHYKSNNIDFLSRLSQDATTEDVLEFYRNRLNIYYDEVSGILTIAFSHVDSYKAQNILKFLVKNVEEQINEFNRKKTKKQLTFVKSEYEKAKKKMENSSTKLEQYQNQNLLLDPTAQAVVSNTIIAELEGQLTQKNIEYSAKKNYLNEDNFELVSLKSEIDEIQVSIQRAKKSLTGKEDKPLNKSMFEYEKLKRQLEFDIEVYKNSLIQLETTKLEVEKNNKILSIVSKPNLPDGYTYPDKLKVFITIIILTLMTYGIVSMLNSIIKDHKE